MTRGPSVARGVAKAYEKLLSANLRKEAPPWLHAMRSTPPADSLVREPTQFSTHGQLGFEKTAGKGNQGSGVHGTQIRRTLPKGCVAVSHQKARLRTKGNRPPKIVFPEDRLRREFYKNHPFETYRPRILMELTGKTNQEWKQLTDGTGQVTGENVIRYQYYLMQARGMTREAAYAQATREFYAVRAREDAESKTAQEEARFYGARMLEKPFSARILRLEESEIRRSTKVFMTRAQEQQIRDTTADNLQPNVQK
ncbi:mitochondrial ribosomal small subunit component [Coemansia sp. RSA 1365]|nr:mitochondrial ribosomal small subunit component [Coemansia sp. RSA 1365]